MNNVTVTSPYIPLLPMQSLVGYKAGRATGAFEYRKEVN